MVLGLLLRGDFLRHRKYRLGTIATQLAVLLARLGERAEEARRLVVRGVLVRGVLVRGVLVLLGGVGEGLLLGEVRLGRLELANDLVSLLGDRPSATCCAATTPRSSTGIGATLARGSLRQARRTMLRMLCRS